MTALACLRQNLVPMTPKVIHGALVQASQKFSDFNQLELPLSS